MANTAFNHDPALTVAASNTTAGAAVKWVASKNLGESLIILDSGGNGRIGLAGDLDLITLTANTVTVAGTVAATALTGDGSALTGISAGATLSGSTDNTIVTVTGANAMQGEANLTFTGSLLTVTGDANVTSNLFINDTANANQTAGITINQTTNDNHILTFKSGGDVNTGLTSLPSQDVEIDDYAIFKKSHPTKGGLVIYGLNTNNTRALDFYGYAGTDNTAKNVNASSHNALSAIRHDNSNALAAFTANSNIFMLEKVDSGGSAARFLWDVEGSAHADVEWTTYDDYNDIELLRGIHGALTPDYKTTFGKDMMYNLSRYEDLGFVGKDSVHWEEREDGRKQLRGMVNFTQLSMLHHSTIIQMADQFTARIESLETQLKAVQAD